MAVSLEGQTLGKYQVLEPLGKGGMARVYRGYHPQLDRYVAIKVLRSDLVDDDAFLIRFQREAQAVAALRHPHIIQVYDFDVQDDLYFMVMELVDGDTLHTRLNDYRVRDEQMPAGEMMRVLLDVLDGLTYAHQEGMIHRDIKPANILLTKRGQAVVADFGIAQIIGGTRHTVSGALLGTLNYMAPEQGLKGTSDARSDLYSLGVVFYEMLTRRPPFEADTPLAILMKHVNDPLPLPRTVDPLIPEAFERIVLKAMAKQPADRHQSAPEMAEALWAAAKQLDVSVPERISLPLTFTTQNDPGESVAVFSGTAREKITNPEFAAQETSATQNSRWIANLGSLKDEDTAVVEPQPQTKVVPPAVTQLGTVTGATVVAAIMKAFAILFLGNMFLVMLTGIGGGYNQFAVLWPVELFFLAAGFGLILQETRAIGLLIPGGILLGNALLLTYYSLTGNWHQWAYLWPLELFLILGTIWYTVSQYRQRKSDAWRRHKGFQIKLIAIAGAVFITLVSFVVGPR